MSQATIVFAPSGDPATGLLLDEARAAAIGRLEAAGHDVAVLDLTNFDPVMTTEERLAYHSPRPLIDETTSGYANAIRSSRVLVFVYPTVMFTVPAAIKGWLDRVMVPGVAFTMSATRRPQRGLRHVERLVGVSTYDASWLQTQRVGDSGRRILARNLRMCTTMSTRVRWVPMYRTDLGTAEADGDGSAGRRARFLARVARAVAP